MLEPIRIILPFLTKFFIIDLESSIQFLILKSVNHPDDLPCPLYSNNNKLILFLLENFFKNFHERIKGFIGIAPAPDFTEELIWKKLNSFEKDNIRKNKIYKLKSSHNNFYPITKNFNF